MYRVWESDETEEILFHYENGMRVAQIANLFNTTKNSIIGLANRNKVRHGNAQNYIYFTPEGIFDTVLEVAEFYNMKYITVAKRFDNNYQKTWHKELDSIDK